MKYKLVVLWALCLATPAYAENITVSAAASLKEAFQEIAQQYQKRYPHDKIKLNTAASGVLLQQLAHGAPIDVLATADQATMDKAAQRHLIQPATRRIFAVNELVLVAPKSSPIRMTQLSDLRQNGVRKIAIGQPASVPAGAYAQQALQQYHLFDPLKPKYIYTQNVRQALDYVVRGAVDVAFVYQTDARLKPVQILTKVPTPSPMVYPIAITQSSKQTAAAQRFRDYVVSPAGQAVLQRYGFKKN